MLSAELVPNPRLWIRSGFKSKKKQRRKMALVLVVEKERWRKETRLRSCGRSRTCVFTSCESSSAVRTVCMGSPDYFLICLCLVVVWFDACIFRLALFVFLCFTFKDRRATFFWNVTPNMNHTPNSIDNYTCTVKDQWYCQKPMGQVGTLDSS